MSLARYLSKLAGLVGSDGKVPMSALSGILAKGQLPSGAVLQVVSAVKTDTFSTTSSSGVDITGLSASITPTSASSKILILSDCSFGGSAGNAAVLRLAKNGSVIYGGDFSSGRPNGLAWGYNGSDYNLQRSGGVYLDSPATTSAITYNLKLSNTDGINAAYINRSTADRAATNYDLRTASSITLMEIAG